MSENCPNTDFFLVRILPHLDWIRRVNLRIQSKCGKIRTRKNSVKEVCYAENFQLLLRENINSKLNLFPDKLHNSQGLSTHFIFESFNKEKMPLLKVKRVKTFFFLSGFSSQTLTIHRTAGERRGPSFIPLYHCHLLTNIETFVCNFAYEMTITYF